MQSFTNARTAALGKLYLGKSENQPQTVQVLARVLDGDSDKDHIELLQEAMLYSFSPNVLHHSRSTAMDGIDLLVLQRSLRYGAQPKRWHQRLSLLEGKIQLC